MLNVLTNIADSSTVPRIDSLNSTVLEMTDWLERQIEDAIGGKQEHLGYALCFMCNFNSVSALQWWPPFESLPTTAIIIVADIPFQALCNPV